MNMKRRPYKTYPKEFKVEAVRMMRESDRPVSEIAVELGILGEGSGLTFHIPQQWLCKM